MTDTDPSKRTAHVRAVQSQATLAEQLGELKNLPGYWEGTGFSLIARPHFEGGDNDMFLQLNLLRETLEITTIGSPVLNRGSVQGAISIFGVTYLHRVTDAVTGGALHIEPGMWLNIPATTDPKADASIARLGTIPHGNAFCTVGFTQQAQYDRIPEIPPANVIPFPIGGTPPAPGSANPFPQYDLSIATPNRSQSLPPEITQAIVNDPNQVLRDTLARQVNDEGKVLNWITRLITMTPDDRSIGNIPFITTNANTLSLESVFAIESVTDANGDEFLQLQYSQTGLINFKGLSFPHITVGTLTKAF
ncbi:heme-binding protein [uncultured Rhodoblastus sp.]|uniref:heme-binding protein n=1 Tax=uncultured Rhodoblastus sp. TaxID=543037 RepID=UPI0025E9E15F|nr:heme-binding protein [uncultured Rhodoblastus sp.]